MHELLYKIGVTIMGLQGWCTAEKAQWLARWIVEHGSVSCVDLGVFGGRSLVAMGMAQQYLRTQKPGWPGRVVGIDSYSNSDCVNGVEGEENKEWWATVDLKMIRKGAEDAIMNFGLGSICPLMIMTGVEAVPSFGDESLDLVHIDGSHGEEESVRDVKLWWPKIRAGGVMVMDDTDWPSVRAARRLAQTLGKRVHQHPQWEAFQKFAPASSTVEFPPG